MAERPKSLSVLAAVLPLLLAATQMASHAAAAGKAGEEGKIVGWRGDGTGRFPDARPPLHWGRVAKSVKSLRARATKPKPGETGTPIPDGVIREWLILGPVPVAEGRRLYYRALNYLYCIQEDPGDWACVVQW